MDLDTIELARILETTKHESNNDAIAISQKSKRWERHLKPAIWQWGNVLGIGIENSSTSKSETWNNTKRSNRRSNQKNKQRNPT